MCRDIQNSLPEGDAWNVHLTAVEGCMKTAEFLKKEGVYDSVEAMTLQEWVNAQTPEKQYDLIICGDVLEHLPRKVCFRMIQNFLKHAKSLLIQVPLRNLSQEAFEENELECHRAYLTAEDFDRRYILGERHSVIMPNCELMQMWILASNRRRLRDRVKTALLKCGGHGMYRFLKKLGISDMIYADYWGNRVQELGKKFGQK